MQIDGIHHITAIAGDAQRNLDFYTEVLGLRLVKRTVNFDDPGTYHFYFGDEGGTPGTILTFFPWQSVKHGQRGAGQVSAIAFSVPRGTITFWQGRLRAAGIATEEPIARFDELAVALRDPDGLLLELVEQPGVDRITAWEGGPVPPAHAIRGFAAPTLLLNATEATAALLSDIFGMTQIAREGSRARYAAHGNPHGAPGGHIDILLQPGSARGHNGSGVVHHIAMRARNEEEQLEWRELLLRQGYEVTPVLDRQYFRSIYFRESGGVLFEIATDGPGFTIDEPRELLGESLRLPAWLEGQRDRIQGALPPLRLPQSPQSARRHE